LFSRRIDLLSNHKTTVIVVDDDPSVGRALQLQLEILGFDSVILDSAEKLLAGTTATENACLLLDVYMPEMNGIELCRRLAEVGLHLPTILMSGRDDKKTRELMRKAKPVACLFKPFDQATLLRAIRKAMRQRRKG
jgi:two-component system response regulator FixJ